MNLTVKEVDEKTIKRIAHEYLSAYYVTLKHLGTKYKTSSTTISNILWRGIAEDIIDERVAKYIYSKVVAKPAKGWYQRKLRWDEAFEKRNKLINEKKREAEIQQELLALYSCKEYYENAISSYDSYFYNDENAPTLDELVARLDSIKKRIDTLS